jgi:prepilin signal peptidase PulO-like enzyme (type II secretory pathway)
MFEVLQAGIFGLILGSFANVLILREERSESIGGRSHCVNCARTLRWYELVPVLSFFVLQGRCRTCGSSISWQYPLVEILVALGIVGIAVAPVSFLTKALGIPIFFLLVCIAVYDVRTTYIPNRWAYLFVFFAFGAGALRVLPMHPIDVGMFIIAGPLVASPLFLLWAASRGRWMGLGDGKLALGFGWLLGIIPGFVALALAFVSGAVVGLLLIGITRFSRTSMGFTMKSEVPFGPFLIIGLCIVWFSQLYKYDILTTLGRFLSWS